MEEHTMLVYDGDTGEFVGVLVFHEPLPKHLMLEDQESGEETAYSKEK